MSHSTHAEPPVLTEDLLGRLDVAGPRYTSYPTADRFVGTFNAQQYGQALAARAASAALPLSIYVHIPFCESVCYYCACNKVITRHHERATEYLAALEQEIALHVERLGRGQSASQLHLGGGTPTFLSDDELTRLMSSLRAAFDLGHAAEVSIEVDPRTVSTQRLQHLSQLGFNRLSLGVQDIDPAVQRAVHREQSLQSVKDLLVAARELGFASTNIDLIYGLPAQTPESLTNTVNAIATLRPDRVALYAYAHLPQRFKPQRRIDEKALPQAKAKLSMLSQAIASFIGHGYTYIGMDHFALPEDSLAVAKREGRLHRNFQGYSTQPDCDLIGLGVSAIGRVGATYSQNEKSLPEYYAALREDRWPVARGLELTPDDLLRRAVIMALMCQGRVEFEAIAVAHRVDVSHYFAAELTQLEALQRSGLIAIEPAAIQVTPLGWYFVRAVAMVFDRYLKADRHTERFSRII